MEKIGIYGGSFNPVHNQHVELAILAKEELGLDKLYIMPTFIAPHKSEQCLSAEHRLNMLHLAFDGIDGIEVSDYEIKKGGKSYTYQTVEHFKSTTNAELYFLVGGDMLYDFKTWKNPERILNACTLASFSRQDFKNDLDALQEYFRNTFNKEFIQLKASGKAVSSTKIRVYSSFGLDITELVNERVAKYVKDNDLYPADLYTKAVINMLPKKRVRHTANVVITALSKAKELKLDESKVRIAGTLHDIAKYIDFNTVDGFLPPPDLPEPVIHAFLGEFIARQKLKVADPEILEAIKYHTSAKPNMCTLAKLIFLADMIEEDRSYEGVELLRECFKGDLDECLLTALKEELVHLINKKQPICALTLEAIEYYEKEKRG